MIDHNSNTQQVSGKTNSNFFVWKLRAKPGSSSLRGTDVQNIIATNESIAVFFPQLAVDVFFSLFECDIHVAV